MDGAGSKQGGDRGVAFVDTAVGKDQNAGSVTNGSFCLDTNSRDRFAECGARIGARVRFRNLEQCRDRGSSDAVCSELPDGQHRAVVNGDARELEQTSLVGRFFEKVAASPDK